MPDFDGLRIHPAGHQISGCGALQQVLVWDGSGDVHSGTVEDCEEGAHRDGGREVDRAVPGFYSRLEVGSYQRPAFYLALAAGGGVEDVDGDAVPLEVRVRPDYAEVGADGRAPGFALVHVLTRRLVDEHDAHPGRLVGAPNCAAVDRSCPEEDVAFTQFPADEGRAAQGHGAPIGEVHADLTGGHVEPYGADELRHHGPAD